MVFSDTLTKTGLIEDCEQKLFGDEGYGRISGDDNLMFQFTNRMNRSLDRFSFLAMSADGRWSWDDNNQTTLPIGTTNIVSGQSKYSFSLEHIEIERVLIKDASGNWKIIDPIDQSDENAKTYLLNPSTNVGIPSGYDKIGNSLIFNCSPNYNSTAGLKVYFKRGPYYFTYSNYTFVPGIPSIFHPYLSLYSSFTYSVDRIIKDIAANLAPQVGDMEKQIGKYYSVRNKDEKPNLRPAYQNNK